MRNESHGERTARADLAAVIAHCMRTSSGLSTGADQGSAYLHRTGHRPTRDARIRRHIRMLLRTYGCDLHVRSSAGCPAACAGSAEQRSAHRDMCRYTAPSTVQPDPTHFMEDGPVQWQEAQPPDSTLN